MKRHHPWMKNQVCSVVISYSRVYDFRVVCPDSLSSDEEDTENNAYSQIIICDYLINT